jgi:hypothetical protein
MLLDSKAQRIVRQRADIAKQRRQNSAVKPHDKLNTVPGCA